MQMEMREKYRSHGSPPKEIVSVPQLTAAVLTVAIVLGGWYLGVEYMIRYPSHSFTGLIWMLIIFVVGICIVLGYTSHAKNASFVANESCVTFSRWFCKDLTIYYRDIDTISVYNSHHERHGRNGYSYYAETMLIITLDGQEHYIRAVMDFAPSARIAGAVMMNKMFEMGKLSILKKFIEAREVY